MSTISFDDEKRLTASTKEKVQEVLKRYGIDEDNLIDSTNDSMLLDKIVYSFFLLAKRFYSKDKSIPESWQMKPDVIKTMERDELEQRMDAALTEALPRVFFSESKEAVQNGDLQTATQSMGVSKYVAIPRIIMSKDREYVDAYHELKPIFQALLYEVGEVLGKNYRF